MHYLQTRNCLLNQSCARTGKVGTEEVPFTVEIHHDILHDLYDNETPISQKLLTFKGTYVVADVLHE